MVYISVRIPKEVTVYEAINVFYISDKHGISLSASQSAVRFLPLELSDEALKKENNFLVQEMLILRDPCL